MAQGCRCLLTRGAQGCRDLLYIVHTMGAQGCRDLLYIVYRGSQGCRDLHSWGLIDIRNLHNAHPRANPF